MMQEFASHNSQEIITAFVFGIAFVSFIACSIWTALVSKKYIKYCGDIPNHDK